MHAVCLFVCFVLFFCFLVMIFSESTTFDPLSIGIGVQEFRGIKLISFNLGFVLTYGQFCQFSLPKN